MCEKKTKNYSRANPCHQVGTENPNQSSPLRDSPGGPRGGRQGKLPLCQPDRLSGRRKIQRNCTCKDILGDIRILMTFPVLQHFLAEW